jgi:hypothetical protein
LWGAGNYKCVPFFIIQVVRLYVLLRLLELHYQANHSRFVHPPTPFSCVPQGISLFNVCTTPRRTELLCRHGLWALSQRLHDHSSDTHSHHLSFLSLVLEGPTLLAFDLVLRPSPLPSRAGLECHSPCLAAPQLSYLSIYPYRKVRRVEQSGHQIIPP